MCCDLTGNEILHRLTFFGNQWRVDGLKINTLAVAIKRDNGSQINTSAWLHKNYSVFVTTRMNSKGKNFGGLAEYRINEDGRFVHYPHW